MGHMVIDGRLHADSGDGIYRRVPTGMDEARTSKGAVFPEYAVENGVPYEIIRDPAAYARGLTVNGGSVIYAKASFRPDERRLLRLGRGVHGTGLRRRKASSSAVREEARVHGLHGPGRRLRRVRE